MIPAALRAPQDVLRVDVPADIPAPALELSVPSDGFTLAELEAACRDYAARAGRPYLAFWAQQAALSALSERDAIGPRLRADLDAELERILDRVDYHEEVTFIGATPAGPAPEPATELAHEPEPKPVSEPEPAREPVPIPEPKPLPPGVVLVQPTAALIYGAGPIFTANRRHARHVSF